MIEIHFAEDGQLTIKEDKKVRTYETQACGGRFRDYIREDKAVRCAVREFLGYTRFLLLSSRQETALVTVQPGIAMCELKALTDCLEHIGFQNVKVSIEGGALC